MDKTYILIRELPGISSGLRGVYHEDINQWSFGGRFYFDEHEMDANPGFFVVEKTKEHYEWLSCQKINGYPVQSVTHHSVTSQCPICGIATELDIKLEISR